MTPRRPPLPGLLASALLAAAAPAAAQHAPITFTVIGDVPYGSSEIPEFEDAVADHNVYSPSDFFVHVGDIKSGSSSCVESHYATAADTLHGLAVPAYIVPGDNADPSCRGPLWISESQVPRCGLGLELALLLPILRARRARSALRGLARALRRGV